MLALAIVLRLVKLSGPAAAAVSVNSNLTLPALEAFMPSTKLYDLLVEPSLEKSLLWFTRAIVKSLLFWISLAAVEFKDILLTPVDHDVISAE